MTATTFSSTYFSVNKLLQTFTCIVFARNNTYSNLFCEHATYISSY